MTTHDIMYHLAKRGICLILHALDELIASYNHHFQVKKLQSKTKENKKIFIFTMESLF